MRFRLALLLLAFASLAQAQDRKYAVLSLIGDQLLIVERETSTELFAAQARMLEEDAPVKSFLPTLRPVLEKAGATHVVLVTKLRQEARLRILDGTIGAGKIEGVGFYIDKGVRMRNVDTGEMSQGYVAPFA